MNNSSQTQTHNLLMCWVLIASFTGQLCRNDAFALSFPCAWRREASQHPNNMNIDDVCFWPGKVKERITTSHHVWFTHPSKIHSNVPSVKHWFSIFASETAESIINSINTHYEKNNYNKSYLYLKYKYFVVTPQCTFSLLTQSITS